MTRKEQAFRLFSQGKGPKDPEVKALGIRYKTLGKYWRLFQKGERTSPTVSRAQAGSGGAVPTTNLDDASLVTISPKQFTMTSSLLWQAREAAIREWGWDPSISPEDFLDTYLYVSFKQRGIILGGYQVFGKDKE